MSGLPGPMRVAVVDVDRGFVLTVAKRLEQIGAETRVLSAAPPSAELLAMRVNAILLDAGLLGSRTFDFLERLSRELPTVAVIVAAESSTIAQRVRGLEMGADDWVQKPCHPAEMVARLRAVLRRRDPLLGIDPGPLTAGEVEIRPDRYQVFSRGRSADLTRREFELLRMLARAERRVVSREEIYSTVWGYSLPHGDRSVDVYVTKVRAKLGKVSPGWSYIHTHFGIGYRFEAEPPDAPVGRTVSPVGPPIEDPGVDPSDRAAACQPRSWLARSSTVLSAGST